MTIYICNSEKNYLNEVVSWILNKFPNDLSSIDIIVSDVLIADSLQNTIIRVNKSNLFTLPRIFPIQSLLVSNSDIILSENSTFISHQAIILIISKSIRSLSKNKISFKAAIAMSQKIIEILHDFYKAGQNINNIDKLFYDFAEHDNFLRDFLYKINKKYQNHLKNTSKTDYVFNLVDQIKKLTKIIQNDLYRRNLIIIGIVDEFLYPLFKTMIAKKHHVFLPPFSQQILLSGDYIPNLLDHCNLNISDLCNASSLDNDTNKSNTRPFDQEFAYKEFEIDIQEINFIVKNIKMYFQDKENTQVTIITDNNKLIQTIENIFNKTNIVNKVGNLIRYNKVANLLLSIAQLFSTPIKIKDFLNLLKAPYIKLDTYEFECYIYKKNLQDCSIVNILTSLSKKHVEIFNIYNKISQIESLDINKYQLFSDLFKINLKILETIHPKIWNTTNGELIISYIKEIYDSVQQNHKILIKDYPSLINILFSGKFYKKYDNLHNQTISIISPHQIPYLNNSKQYIIVPDFFQDNWPPNVHQDAFLTSNMRKSLNLEDKKSKINDLYQCYFDYLKQFDKVTFSRSKKISKSYTRRSQYAIAIPQNNHNTSKVCTSSVNQAQLDIDDSNKAISFTYSKEEFKKISATQIDLLSKNPYEYYAKKILNLKYVDFFKSDPTAADFGSFIHKTIELFSKSSYKTKDFFLSIAENLLSTTYHNKKTLWYEKIERIAEEFILLDNVRNKNTKQIFSEEYGQMTLKLNNNKSIIVFGIFDKVELCDDKITILDYKTGSIPTVKSIKEGKNLQLIIGLLIASYGKFKNLPYLKKVQDYNIVYVKLNNKSPYWQTLEIALSKDFLYKQYCNLKDMLNYFTKNNTKYNYLDYPYCDYKYLSRHQVNQ